VEGTFARSGVVRQGWYLLASGGQLRPGRVRAIEAGKRRLVVYRDHDGRAHVVDDLERYAGFVESLPEW
jgi:phenylpropionate dioxygenase-like ring-hydroxylating dioxygenase large terminal subunit